MLGAPVFLGFTPGPCVACLQVWQVSWAHPKFGHLLASCSFDRKVQISAVPREANARQQSVLFWSSCSTSCYRLSFAAISSRTVLQVMIWKETAENQWRPIFTAALEASVNSIAWAPHEIGLMLAAGEHTP